MMLKNSNQTAYSTNPDSQTARYSQRIHKVMGIPREENRVRSCLHRIIDGDPRELPCLKIVTRCLIPNSPMRSGIPFSQDPCRPAGLGVSPTEWSPSDLIAESPGKIDVESIFMTDCIRISDIEIRDFRIAQ